MSKTLTTDYGHIELTTNNHVREVVDAWDLPTEARADFDYLDWEAIERGDDTASFIRYRGDWYDLCDVERPGANLAADGWHAMIGETYWSGIVFRYADDPFGPEGVVVARFACYED